MSRCYLLFGVYQQVQHTTSKLIYIKAMGGSRVVYTLANACGAQHKHTYYHRITYVVRCIYHAVGFLCSVGRCEYVGCYEIFESQMKSIDLKIMALRKG